jgi:hypothetical protein
MADNEIPVNIRVHGKEEAQSSLMELGKTIAVVFSAEKLVEFTKRGLEELSKINTASKELTAVFGHQAEGLIKLGEASAKTSTFRAPEIIQGEKLLGTYKMTEAQIKQMLPALLNLATRTGSISSASRLMGMSFENGSKRLGMFGINVHGAIGSQERLNSIIQQTTAALGDQNAAAFEAMNPLEKINRTFNEIAVVLAKEVEPYLQEFSAWLAGDGAREVESFIKITEKGLQAVSDLATFAGSLQLGAGAAMETAQMEHQISLAKNSTELMVIGQALQDRIAKTKYAIGDAERKDLDTTKLKIKLQVEENLLAEQNQKMKKEFVSKHSEPEVAKKVQIELSDQEIAKRKKTLEEKIKLEKEAWDKIYKGAEENVKMVEKATLVNEQDKWKKIIKGAEENKKFLDKLNQDKERGYEVISMAHEKFITKTNKSEMTVLIKKQKEELRLAKLTGLAVNELEQIQSDERVAMIQRETEMKIKFGMDYASSTLTSLSVIADGFKANAQVKKRIAEGEAIISGGKAALGVIENSGEFIGTFGPVAGPILMGAEIALIIAETAAQVSKIESAKMAYGGIARGGTPGVDSIPAMLMPGEVVYNPAHPNPALASMIGGGMSNSNNQQVTNIHMPPIIINGNASRTTTAEMGRVTQKALISALKEAQVNGNVSATGLVVRH